MINFINSFRREQVVSVLKRMIGVSPTLKEQLKPIYRYLSAEKKYDRWIKEHVRNRQKKYGHVQIPKNQFSILTTAWNTPVEYLEILANSLKSMNGFENVEWVILDNGTTNAKTLAKLRSIKSWPNVKFLTTKQNVGIIGGMRMCLESASGKYVLPVDSDDELYPDTLQILQFFIEKNNQPALLYSDEDKVIGNYRRDPYQKPTWDPVLFYHSCYIAHLCVIDRKTALELGAYTNKNTNGSHDWDTFSRFYLAGIEPVHVPKILYSWRMHEGSTAGNIQSKDYIFSSHKEVLSRFIRHQNLENDLEVKISPLFRGTPDWHFSNNGLVTDPWTIISWGNGKTDIACYLRYALFPEWRSQTLASACQKIVEIEQDLNGKKVLLVNRNLSKISSDALTEAEGLFKLFSDTGCIAGRVIGQRDLVVVGDVREKDGEITNDYRGFHRTEYGYFAQALKPHSTNSATPLLSAWKGEHLVDVAKKYLKGQSFEKATAEVLREAKQRIVFDPLLECELSSESAHFDSQKFSADYSRA